jgi:hypothetical protein
MFSGRGDQPIDIFRGVFMQKAPTADVLTGAVASFARKPMYGDGREADRLVSG